MKYYHLIFIVVLLFVLLFGRFLISPQKLFYELTSPGSAVADFPRVKIYSTYPFNNRGEVVINAGSELGVKEKMAVTVDGKVLFGQIVQVFENYSIVRAFFDKGWQVPVRVGFQETDALLEGGSTPKLTMVAKNKEFNDGETVYSASRDFPYGLPIGKVKKIKDTPTAVFKEAELEAPYSFNDLRELELWLR